MQGLGGYDAGSGGVDDKGSRGEGRKGSRTNGERNRRADDPAEHPECDGSVPCDSGSGDGGVKDTRRQVDGTDHEIIKGRGMGNDHCERFSRTVTSDLVGSMSRFDCFWRIW